MSVLLIGGLNNSPGLDCTSWYVQGKNPRGRQSESESELEFL